VPGRRGRGGPVVATIVPAVAVTELICSLT
jgi:hypothetical protein